jgi:hypothetical protein
MMLKIYRIFFPMLEKIVCFESADSNSKTRVHSPYYANQNFSSY